MDRSGSGDVVKEIFVDIQRCMGCRACEIACAIEHSESKVLAGALLESPAPQARVQVESAGVFAYPVRCLSCGDAPCIAVCPNGAMHRDADSGAVVVDEQRCIGCMMCASICLFGAISARRVKRLAVKCDRCPTMVANGQDPACVEACPTKALRFIDETVSAQETRRNAAQRVALAMSGGSKPPATEYSPMDALRGM